ncbi:MAG: hypothetical protein WD048_15895 [Chitinophagales bacterium]
MLKLDKYRFAKKDIDMSQAPYRKNGTFHFTPGLGKIMGHEKYKAIRKLNNDIKSLEEERDGIFQEMLHYRTSYEKLEKGHHETSSSLDKELKRIEEELELKKSELEQHKEHMDKRDVVLVEEEPQKEVEEEKPSKPKKKKWVLPFAIFLMYIVIEAFTYITQIDSLRDVKSYEEIGARVLAMFVLILLFHIVAHMARKSKKLIYNIAMGFFLLMIGIMMFAPTTLHYIYPEQTETTDASMWSIDEANAPADNIANISNPEWVELYRKMEWAPAGLGILFFLIIFFIVPNPYFSKPAEEDTVEKEMNDEEFPVQEDDTAWALNKWKQLKKEVQILRTKKENIEAEIQNHKTNAEDLIPLSDKLESLKKKTEEIDQSITSKEIERTELFTALKDEFDEYRAEYEDILSGDSVKQAILKPEWPETKDIINHFKIS